MSVPSATGGWADVVESINTLVSDVMYPCTRSRA